ncbi:hypothetical protein N7462_004950 [Penicillium macrosclerotiorum]|uniref:uncharacterized protein n=1 Tax=Penicillium macrosclerotiorum TaxID=303699 RepID=UPI002548C597|nr:uncharacterized protein N7462_004950 [Penicillium macrosclerotiorum]KAJ5690558.1 hypothetical protein N7462_004950 [Penicillium macrosclerotiorum]
MDNGFGAGFNVGAWRILLKTNSQVMKRILIGDIRNSPSGLRTQIFWGSLTRSDMINIDEDVIKHLKAVYFMCEGMEERREKQVLWERAHKVNRRLEKQ